MARPIPRKTIYAATLITILALSGGWVLALGTTTTTGPAQSSSITVTAPSAFSVATVQSTQLLTVSPALIGGLIPAGVQEGAGNGLNSSYLANVVLNTCATNCGQNFSAVDPSAALVAGDSALQVMLVVTQPTTTPSGFDIQVEILYSVGATPMSSFGTGYFDTGTTSHVAPATFSVALYVDLGTSALNLPSVGHILVTMNACTSATTCP